jgi:hypothetical protein
MVAALVFARTLRKSFHLSVHAETCQADVRAGRSRIERAGAFIPDVEYLGNSSLQRKDVVCMLTANQLLPV